MPWSWEVSKLKLVNKNRMIRSFVLTKYFLLPLQIKISDDCFKTLESFKNLWCGIVHFNDRNVGYTRAIVATKVKAFH